MLCGCHARADYEAAQGAQQGSHAQEVDEAVINAGRQQEDRRQFEAPAQY